MPFPAIQNWWLNKALNKYRLDIKTDGDGKFIDSKNSVENSEK